MEQPKRIVEMYVNSYLDRVENENNSTSKRFTVSLDRKSKQIQLLAGEKELRLKVFAVELPNVLYNFKETESRLWFDYGNTGSSSTIRSIQIDVERVYSSPSDLVTEINSKFSADASLNGMTIDYDDNTKKTTLTNSTGTTVRLISSFRYASSETILTYDDMNDRLGFSLDYTTTGVILNSGTLEGNGYIRMNRTNRFHITLEQQAGYYNQSITPLKDINHRIVASVATGSYGTLSTFNYVSSFGFLLPSAQPLTELTFAVRDDEFELVDFVNHPISMALQFEIV